MYLKIALTADIEQAIRPFLRVWKRLRTFHSHFHYLLSLSGLCSNMKSKVARFSKSRGLSAIVSFLPLLLPLFLFLDLTPFFACAKHRESRSSVFPCSPTPRKRLLRRLAKQSFFLPYQAELANPHVRSARASYAVVFHRRWTLTHQIELITQNHVFPFYSHNPRRSYNDIMNTTHTRFYTHSRPFVRILPVSLGTVL